MNTNSPNSYLVGCEAPEAPTTLDASYTPSMFTIDGRIGRLRLLAYLLVINCLGGVLAGIAVVFFPLVQAIMVVIELMVLTGSVIVGRRRLLDMGKGGFWYLFLLVPVLNTVLHLYLLCSPGKQGPNQFGPPPAPNTQAFVFGTFACLILLVIAAIVLVAIFFWVISNVSR